MTHRARFKKPDGIKMKESFFEKSVAFEYFPNHRKTFQLGHMYTLKRFLTCTLQKRNGKEAYY